MIGNEIRWIGSGKDSYLTIRLEEDRKVKFYFTVDLLEELHKKHKDFFDKEDNSYNLMIGYDNEGDGVLLYFGISKEKTAYTSAFKIRYKDSNPKGKPKTVTNRDLRDYVENGVEKDKFKLLEYESKINDDGILVLEFYLDNPIYY